MYARQLNGPRESGLISSTAVASEGAGSSPSRGEAPRGTPEAMGGTSLAIRSHQPCRDTNRPLKAASDGQNGEGHQAGQGGFCLLGLISALGLSRRWCGLLPYWKEHGLLAKSQLHFSLALSLDKSSGFSEPQVPYL